MKPSDITLVSILVAQPTLTVEEAARTVAMRQTIASTEKRSGGSPTRPASRQVAVRALYQRAVATTDWSN